MTHLESIGADEKRARDDAHKLLPARLEHRLRLNQRTFALAVHAKQLGTKHQTGRRIDRQRTLRGEWSAATTTYCLSSAHTMTSKYRSPSSTNFVPGTGGTTLPSIMASEGKPTTS